MVNLQDRWSAAQDPAGSTNRHQRLAAVLLSVEPNGSSFDQVDKARLLTLPE
jgi:hypothetical protein